MTKLILVKNGPTDWNKLNRFQGAVDIPLNDEGKRDARRIASDLSPIKIDAIYASNLSRSYETADEIASGHNLKSKILKELGELNLGVWQGLCLDNVRKRYKKQYTLWRKSPFSAKPPQGESMKEAYDRVVNIVQKIIEKHKGETICIVSHQIVLALVKYHFNHEDMAKIWGLAPKISSWEIIEV